MAHLIPLKQSTATTLLLGPFLDDTDGKTAEPALTIAQADVLLWKEGGTTLAQKNESTSCTHRSNGLYTCPIDSTDTNTLGILTVSVAESGALPIRQDYSVVPAVVYDEMFNAFYARAARGIITYGTAQSATGTTLVMAAGESNADDVMVGATLMAYGTNQGYWQSRTITDLVNTTDTLTVDTWTVTPSGTIYYMVLAGAPVSASDDFTTTQKASINAEVVDVLRTDTVAELTGVPAANASIAAKIGWLYMKARNVITQTATTQLVKADDGTTTVGTATVSDNGTVATRGEFS